MLKIMVSLQWWRLYKLANCNSFIASHILPPWSNFCSFFPFRSVSSTLICDKIYIGRWSWNIMAVILNVTSNRYCIQCVLDFASCEIVTCKNTSYRQTCIGRTHCLPQHNSVTWQTAYLKTCEANGAAPSKGAVALINPYQLIIWWREVQI